MGVRVFRCGCEGFSLQVLIFWPTCDTYRPSGQKTVAGERFFGDLRRLDPLPATLGPFTSDTSALHLRHQSWEEGMPFRGTPFRASHSIPPPHITLVRGCTSPERHPFLRGKCARHGVMAFPAQYIISGPARGRFCCKWMKGLECEDGTNQNRFGRKFAGPVYDTTTTDEHAIGLGGKNSNL